MVEELKIKKTNDSRGGKNYTILLERRDGKETWIHQVSGPKRDFDAIADSWSRLIIEEGIVQGEDIEILLEELTEDVYENFVPVTILPNVWWGDVLLSRYLYLITIIESATVPLQTLAYKGNLLPIVQAQKVYKRYEQYEKAYHNLKRYGVRNTSSDRDRKKAEKWMKYWAVKSQFMSHCNVLKGDKASKSLYTFCFEYKGDSPLIQLWLSASYLDLILVAWVEKMLQEVDGSEKSRKLIDNEADRLLLMERAMDERYYPEPISGLVNVWGTYFTLSKGLGNLTIIKTCPH